MNVLRNGGKLMASLIFALAICAIANAQTSTFVASNGNDSNPCSRAAPCRTLQVGVNTVLTGGTVVVLDSAGYGTLAIGKSVLIFAPSGVNAAINATSGTAISITAGTVRLSGLQLNGSGTAATGLSVSGGTAIVQNTSVTRFITGVSVSNTKVDLIHCDISGNTTGITSSGTGADMNNFPINWGTTGVRLAWGSVTNNGTALNSVNPGTNRNNILEFITSNTTAAYSTYFAGNTTFFTGSGTGCPCSGIGHFSSSTNPN